jgi:hypothetical protein
VSTEETSRHKEKSEIEAHKAHNQALMATKHLVGQIKTDHAPRFSLAFQPSEGSTIPKHYYYYYLYNYYCKNVDASVREDFER